MDYLRIGRVTEEDFCTIVENAGGRRLCEDDSTQDRLNCDFVFDDALIELKLIEEEGLEKAARRNKLSQMFRMSQPDRPVVILAPSLLAEAELNSYYNIMAGPMQTAIKKAAKQLHISSDVLGKTKHRAVVLLNVGYTAVDHNEFKRIAIKCCQNDTSKIDSLIVGGIYHHSDGFDSYSFFPLEHIPINIDSASFDFGKLLDEWHKFAEGMMTLVVRGESTILADKLPVLDLVYDLDGITYVKPSPRFGQPSGFWEERPRHNTTGIKSCPQVGVVFPDFTPDDWLVMNGHFRISSLCSTYAEWQDHQRADETRLNLPEKPSVRVPVRLDEFDRWCLDNGISPSRDAVNEYACEIFDRNVKELIKAAVSFESAFIRPSRYIRVITQEIGRDKANDLSSISIVEERLSEQVETPLVCHLRIFHQYALALASAYALKFDVGKVMYTVDKTYGWE